MSVRVRFAPSPTGYLHVGGARTALYNWLYAKKMKGDFVLRIEDTDQERSTVEALRMQIGDLKWLGLEWQEGPTLDGEKDFGPHSPYKQSQRLRIYKEHAERLLKSGKAYYCFCSEAELEEKKQAAVKAGLPPHYDGKCRNLGLPQSQARIAAGEKAVVRFNVGTPKDYVLNDLIRGDVTFPSSMVGDFVVLRSDGMPVYNFCCVVDDALMKITHVLRAEEHLSNSLRQMMLYESFGYALPQFGHLSIILGPDKQKLSKRHGATSCHEYMKSGYLPEALLNFIALLGWSSPKGDEIMSIENMIEQFSLDRFNSAPAVFDEVKLKHFNATHLRALPHVELWKRLKPFLDEAGLELPNDPQWQDRALTVLKTSMETLKDGVELFRYFSDKSYVIHAEANEVYSWDTSIKVMEAWKNLVSSHASDSLSESDFNMIQDKVKEAAQVKGKNLFMPIRVAVIGKPHGAELKQLVPLMKKSSLLTRVDTALKYKV